MLSVYQKILTRWDITAGGAITRVNHPPPEHVQVVDFCFKRWTSTENLNLKKICRGFDHSWQLTA